MTLTLLETIEAIGELNTEGDIIIQACQRIAEDATNERTDLSTHKIAEFIIRDYEERASMEDLMFACCLVAGRIGAILCKLGGEATVTKGLKAIMMEEFMHTRLKRVVRAELEDDG